MAGPLWRSADVPPRYGEARLFDVTDLPEAAARGQFAVTKEVIRHVLSPSIVALLGAVGEGKTRLLCALVHEFTRAGLSARYVSTPEFLADAADPTPAWRRTGSRRPPRDNRTPHLLVLDEIDKHMGDDRAVIRLGNLIDRRYSDLRVTVLAGNVNRDDLHLAVGRYAVSRIWERGDVIQCGWGDLRPVIGARFR